MAQFFIQVDKQFYFSGQTVNGFVWVNVPGLIQGASGISLRFTGYECVKWVQAERLHRPAKHNDPNRPQPIDPIALIPPNQIFHSDAPIVVSDPQSQDNRQFDHRPSYIRNSRDEYYKMRYYETRNMFTKNRMPIYQCNGFATGQYSFPFSFKTFQGWPASFSHITTRKKGLIIYQMTVVIEGMSKGAQIKFSRQITLRETRIVRSQQKTSSGEITSCCCLSQGISSTDIQFEKDGYMPGELVQMVIEVDNTNCEANINWINVNINKSVTMRSNGASTGDGGSIFSKQLIGVPARMSRKGNQAIREAFTLPPSQQLKPTCSGKLLSCTYSLSVVMDHDINCECCSDRIGGSIPIIIFPFMRTYAVPSLFTNNWQPQMMPATNLVLQNNFNNFNLSSLGNGQQYPPSNFNPPPQQPPQNYGQQPNFGQGNQNNNGQGPQFNNGQGNPQNNGQGPQFNNGQGNQNNNGQGPQFNNGQGNPHNNNGQGPQFNRNQMSFEENMNGQGPQFNNGQGNQKNNGQGPQFNNGQGNPQNYGQGPQFNRNQMSFEENMNGQGPQFNNGQGNERSFESKTNGPRGGPKNNNYETDFNNSNTEMNENPYGRRH